MKTHDLKIRPEFFAPVRQGVKTAEIRLNDRNFQVGDLLELNEWNSGHFTGAFVVREITHVADISEFKPGYVLLSMIPFGMAEVA
ncbi:DUF3850 domain-containing protein [Yersinia enterocolitica]|uniref:DUF3850 domain-containing protein n=1 Tax=Yersinia TaxID=629 RepID=UPI0005E20442|nr:DUF3850 domain-containing protein [Yersinia enterocolitica]EKN5943897.1 DUF3850 domain-containing protein [Yersinia enterocolitica]EKN6243450.1 DUF3850 domain-containing protein [Yersinia enterocolitica]ELX2277059.1 DUF3850 domain-containing protein [Yersinia enterocolitica]MBX9488787.1 DUF3850 domain-containing protein [Yersinia enterocolitica]MBX9492983.1 DUF3850 domain-containing protein [Yersinia enterocolitica]